MFAHADIQTTMIYLHERDCIVTTAEDHIPNCSLPPFAPGVSDGTLARRTWGKGSVPGWSLTP